MITLFSRQLYCRAWHLTNFENRPIHKEVMELRETYILNNPIKVRIQWLFGAFVYRERSLICRSRRVTRDIYTSQIVCVLGSRSAVAVWAVVAAKLPVCSSSWPGNTATRHRAPRRASAVSAAPTTSSSTVARDATVAKEMTPPP